MRNNSNVSDLRINLKFHYGKDIYINDMSNKNNVLKLKSLNLFYIYIHVY